MRAFVLTASVVALTAGAAVCHTAGAADAENGKRLAQQWCQVCHHIGGDQRSALADVPTFPVLAKDPAKTREHLKAFLANPHPPMPKFELSRTEVDDLVAFIQSLK